MPKQIENVDYQLVPVEDMPEAWAVRILTGEFIETIIAYGAVAFNEVKDHLSYNFVVVTSPNDQAVTENEDLQVLAGDILSSIIENGIEDGSVEFKDKNADES